MGNSVSSASTGMLEAVSYTHLELKELNGRLADDPFLGKGTLAVSQVFFTSPSRCAVAYMCAVSVDRRLDVYKRQDMVKAMFGLHAPFTLSDATLDRCVRENDGVTGFHVHVSEGMDDVYDSLRNHGRRPVQRLQDHGILGPKTIAGHCIHEMCIRDRCRRFPTASRCSA